MPNVRPSPRYLKLIGRFPLRPLRSDEELEEATEVAEELDFRDDLTPDERDYLDVLIGLIERYEDEHHPIPDVSGPEALKSLIEFRGISQSEVARGAGIADSVLSEILHGKRHMGLKTIEALAGYFRVDPGLFISEPPAPRGRHAELE
jgi:HTH-type transcriptional regulator/antitoxin HigA